MGPGKQGEVHGVVALVPNGKYYDLALHIWTNQYRTNEGGSEIQSILGLWGEFGQDAGDLLWISYLGHEYFQVRLLHSDLFCLREDPHKWQTLGRFRSMATAWFGEAFPVSYFLYFSHKFTRIHSRNGILAASSSLATLHMPCCLLKDKVLARWSRMPRHWALSSRMFRSHRQRKLSPRSLEWESSWKSEQDTDLQIQEIFQARCPRASLIQAFSR